MHTKLVNIMVEGAVLDMDTHLVALSPGHVGLHGLYVFKSIKSKLGKV